MRGAWGLIGLLIALAVVGLVAKQRLATMGSHAPTANASSASGGLGDAAGGHPAVDTPQQRRQLEQKMQDDVNRLMQSRTPAIDQEVDRKIDQNGDAKP
ncbi:MAG: hypothetical protein KGL90_13790 [Burkholderiales bacterium]|nr:hypothetical protein [Burkholderiales bacterium]